MLKKPPSILKLKRIEGVNIVSTVVCGSAGRYKSVSFIWRTWRWIRNRQELILRGRGINRWNWPGWTPVYGIKHCQFSRVPNKWKRLYNDDSLRGYQYGQMGPVISDSIKILQGKPGILAGLSW